MGGLKGLGVAWFCILLAACEAPPDPAMGMGWTWAPASDGDRVEDAESRASLFTPLEGRLDEADLAALLPNQEGMLWLRKDLTFAPITSGEPAVLLLGPVIVADQTFINGGGVGHGGRFPPVFGNGWNHRRVYPLPPAVANAGRATVLIKLYVNGEGGVGGPIRVGTVESVRGSLARASFFEVGIHQLIAFLALVLAWYHLVIFFRRPHEKATLIYAGVCLATFVHRANFFLGPMEDFLGWQIPYLGHQKIVFSAIAINSYLYIRFFREFLDHRPGRAARVMAIGAAVVPFMALMAAPSYPSFLLIRNLSMVFTVVPIVLTIHVVVSATRRGDKDARNILMSSTLLAVGVTHDVVIHMLLKVTEGPYLATVGFGLFVISIAGIMASRFARYGNELEELNRTLEQRVAQRTAELERVNVGLQQTNQQLEQAHGQLVLAATKDGLTGLDNRQELQRRLDAELQRLERGGARSLSVMFIDLDNFKYYNDSFGHVAGDTILKLVANVLRSSVRAVDVVGRFGGDEFLVLLPDTEAAGAVRIAGRIQAELGAREGFRHEIASMLGREIDIPPSCTLSCSSGVATCREGVDGKAFLERADQALYAAKRAGKNRCVCHSAEA